MSEENLANGILGIVNELEARVTKEVQQTCETLVPKFTSNHRVVIEDKKIETGGEVESAHASFGKVMEKFSIGLQNVLLVGPTGSGKTHLCQDIAKAMNLPFGLLSLSEGVSESHLFGRVLPQKDGAWDWSPTSFINIFENGGVFLFDEFDCASPNLLLSVNAALAQGEFHNIICDKRHVRHPKCFIICAANTFGHGADVSYVGRNQLDAATLDRFTLGRVFVNYDEALELRIISELKSQPKRIIFRKLISDLRSIIKEKRLRRFVSTRFVINGVKALHHGCELSTILSEFFEDWSEQEKRHVLPLLASSEPKSSDETQPETIEL